MTQPIHFEVSLSYALFRQTQETPKEENQGKNITGHLPCKF